MIHERYAEPLVVTDMAAQVGMSRSQFGRVFRKLFGLSPRDYLTSVSVNAAAHLLSETELKTTEIALQSGFYDHSHFTREFKLEAVRLLEGGERSGIEISRELGIRRNLLYKWQKELQSKGNDAFQGRGTVPPGEKGSRYWGCNRKNSG